VLFNNEGNYRTLKSDLVALDHFQMLLHTERIVSSHSLRCQPADDCAQNKLQHPLMQTTTLLCLSEC
jgi:hypothetical protein